MVANPEIDRNNKMIEEMAKLTQEKISEIMLKNDAKWEEIRRLEKEMKENFDK